MSEYAIDICTGVGTGRDRMEYNWIYIVAGSQ